MVLPFTVLTSFIFLSARPSLSILLACAIVTCGFFVGVFLDGVNVSAKGIIFGVVSSATTAVHAVVIKKAIRLLNDSALDLCWYSNLLSALVLSVVVVLAGEVPRIVALMQGDSSALMTFMWGSLITVSAPAVIDIMHSLMHASGCLWFLDGHRQSAFYQGNVPNYTHGIVCCSWRCWVLPWRLDLQRYHFLVSTPQNIHIYQELLVLMSVLLSGRAASIAIILGGSIYYTWVKHVESQQKPAPVQEKEKAYERVPVEDIEAGKADQMREKPE